MKRSKKQTLYNLPVIGYLAKTVIFLLRAPVVQERFNVNEGEVKDLRTQQDAYEEKFNALIKEVSKSREELDAATRRFSESTATIEDLAYQIRMIQKNSQNDQSKKSGDKSSKSEKKLLADNHLLDKFYLNFENIFRGTEEDIYGRLKVHLPEIKKLEKARGKKLEILDIGCGRGEFIKLMRDNGHSARGLDLNSMMVERARENGFEAVEQDALSYLLEQKNGSLDVISGFHIVEHIPFDELLLIFAECLRVLRPGGIVIFETPNPENITIGSWRFYYDPSHLHPLPPDMLAFALQTCGFDTTDVLRLHPEEESPKGLNDHDAKVHNRLFGPLDYALIGRKWDGKTVTK